MPVLGIPELRYQVTVEGIADLEARRIASGQGPRRSWVREPRLYAYAIKQGNRLALETERSGLARSCHGALHATNSASVFEVRRNIRQEQVLGEVTTSVESLQLTPVSAERRAENQLEAPPGSVAVSPYQPHQCLRGKVFTGSSNEALALLGSSSETSDQFKRLSPSSYFADGTKHAGTA
jgi:hypothetical protein